MPKTIRRGGNRGAGAILGFANFLLRLYDNEKPRAVLVGWDTIDVPTYRHQALASYQMGRTFDDELVEQLEVLPDFVAPCGSPVPRSLDTRPMISWRRQSGGKNDAAGPPS